MEDVVQGVIVEDVVQGVIDTVDTVTQQRIRLSELLESIHDAKTQVVSSSVRSRQQLDAHFKQLKLEVTKLLDARQQQLEAEVREIEHEAVEPLVQSEDDIKNSIRMAKDVMEEGRRLLSGDHEANQQAMEAFKNRDNDLGLNRLPEVPNLCEVPCIHVDLPESPDMMKAKKALRNHGKVMSKAPVQICDIQQRPGAIMVKWNEVDEEHYLDLNDYRLQYCRGRLHMNGGGGSGGGEETEDAEFVEAYQGPNTCHVVRHLEPTVTYTFRVCGRAEGASIWSPWSVTQEGTTSMLHYEWLKNLPNDYDLSIENTAACKVRSNTDDILYSNANSYVCGHAILFKILDTGHEEALDGIGLSATNDDPKSLLRANTIFVSCKGCVYIDGVEKPTKLPPLTRGSVLSFETVCLPDGDKVRVTIEVNERIVTFDWSPEETRKSTAESPVSLSGFAFPVGNEKDKNLYFAMRFHHKDWKISVE